MLYFKQEDFIKCREFLKGKPDTVETQRELYKFMHEECHMLAWCPITVKDMCVYSRVHKTRLNMNTANWCTTMNDGSQVVWNKKYREFYLINGGGINSIDRCDCIDYLDVFPMLSDIDIWLLENWSNWPFQVAQRQLIAIWNGKYDENFRNYWK